MTNFLQFLCAKFLLHVAKCIFKIINSLQNGQRYTIQCQLIKLRLRNVRRSDRGDCCVTAKLLFGITGVGGGLSDSNAALSAEPVCKQFLIIGRR